MSRKRYDNALDEFIDSSIQHTPLTPECIRGLRNSECSYDRDKRRERMIEHGDVDPDYFNR